MKILVLGGTKFFGRRLVHRLIEEGHDITVASRGQTSDDFDDLVQRTIVDRHDANALQAAFRGQEFDVVYDQVGYNPQHAKASVEAFADRIKRYVFTSSGAVYGHKETLLTEADFDAYHYPFAIDAASYEYGEGKRQAEAYLLQHAPFAVVAARVPMVVSGEDDYTGRFEFHVRHVATQKSIGVASPGHPITYVTAWDVADFLRFVGTESDFSGPVNAGNGGYYSTQELCYAIGDVLGVEPMFHVVDPSQPDDAYSPYAMRQTHKLSLETARSIGYGFPELSPQIPKMVHDVMQRIGSEHVSG